MVLRLPRLRHSVQLGWVSLVLAVLVVRSLQAQTLPVGQISTPQTATVTLSASGTPSAINVVTQGAQNLDFKLAAGGTCSTSTAYTSGQSCTVNYTFTPTHPGARYGGITLAGASGNILGSAYIQGMGTGPQITFSGAGHQEPILAVTSYPLAATVDAGGNYYIADYYANGIYVIPAGCTDGSCYKLITISLSGQAAALAVDGIGNLYLADASQRAVLKFPAGCLSTSCMISVGGSIYPNTVAVDGSGKVYVVDEGTNFTYQMPNNCSDASCMTQLGGTFAFNSPDGIAVDPTGNIYVADYYAGIDKLTPGCTDASCVTTITGDLQFASALATDGLGNLFVGTQYIGIFEMQASCLNTGCYTALADANRNVTDIAVDGAENVYYSDSAYGRFNEISRSMPNILGFGVTTSDGSTDTAEGSPTAVITNDGNQPLTFNIPASGTNPAVGPDFTLVTSGGSACPFLTTSAFDVGTLAAGTSCNLPITFTPVQPSNGTVTESIMLTTNNLNVAGSTQSIQVSGIASAIPVIYSLSVNSGSIAGGTSVTIIGGGFTGVTAVMFGSTSATTFTVNSDSSITVISPPSDIGTLVDIAVTGPTGSSIPTSADYFTYIFPTTVPNPTEPIGTASATETVYLKITTAGTVSAINVLTQGAPNLDFKLASGGSCTVAKTYTLNEFCTVNYTFTPTRPGIRRGGVNLVDSSGNTLASLLLPGYSTGPEVAFRGPSNTPIQLGGTFAFNQPSAVATDGFGNVFVADSNAHVLREIPVGCTSASCVVLLAGSAFQPAGLAIDGLGNIFVADEYHGAVYELNPDYPYVTGCPNCDRAVITGLNYPAGIAVDGNGNLYVGDSLYGRVFYAPAACLSCTNIIASGFSQFFGLTIDASGNLYVADTEDSAVLKLPPGCGGPGCSINLGAGAFYEPYSVAVDAAGNVYVANYRSTSSVEMVPPDCTTASCVISLGDFYYPRGVSVDADGNVYVAEFGSSAIKEINFATPPALNFPTSTQDYSSDLTDGTQTATILNIGNQPLVFTVPASGTNVSVTNSNFTAAIGTGTCPQLTPSSTAVTLAAAASCTLSMTFNPVAPASGAVTGSITISDNNLSVTSTQTIPLTGTATLQVPAVTNVSPNGEGPGAGTPVTITGSGFTGATAVNFGSTPAISFTVNSDTSITATPPASSYVNTVDVLVTGPYGTSTANGGDVFSYYLTLLTGPPDQQLGQTSAVQTAYLYFGFPGTLTAVNVLTQGTANLDFKFVSGGTCTPSVTYANNQVCTVNYTFTPTAAGLRKGAITLAQSDGTVLGYVYVQGQGDGPQASYFSPTTTIKTLGAGTGLADGLAVDTSGNVYYSTGNDGTIHYIPAGCMSSVCESQIGSSFRSQTGYYSAPNALSVDGQGYLYVANSSSDEINMIPTFCTTCRVVLGGPQYTYNYPSGIYVDGGGNVFVADTLNNQVAIMPAHCGGTACVKFYGGFSQPTGITTDMEGDIYVADGVLKKYPLGCITCSPITMGGGIDIWSVALDASGKNIYTVDIFDNTLRTMPADCTSTSCVTTLGTFSSPSGVGLDGAGNIYVADNNGVHEILTGTPPAIPFATPTPDGSTDLVDGTQTLTLTNIGNQPLSFTIPVSGNNPSIGPDFTFNQGSGTCPVVTPASSATSLAASASCTIPVTFTPVGAANGALSENLVLTSNNFNVANVTQTIPLTGTASGPSPVIISISPASGATTGGTSVTITGNGFTGTTAVKFGTANATSFTVNGATSITAVSPAQSAGTVADITVTNGGVTSATSAADQFTYALQPKTITFPQPVTPVAVGAQATLSATASSGDPITYSITGGTASLSGNVVTYTTKNTVTITANSAATGIYAAASPVSVTVSVHPQEVFIVNTGGTVASLFGTGVSQSSATSGGGIGAAVDAAGDVWSINANGSGVSVFTDAGAFIATYSGAGISGAKALAIDGNNITWIANSNGTLSALTNAGANALTTPIDPVNGAAAPASISVDTAGSLWLAIPNTTTPSSSTVIEVIGAAAPISTPTVTQVINSTTGTKP